MARKKVKLEFIVNDSTRKTTFKKRKRGLLKKANEITTLCAVEACAIIYSPYEAEPELWPSPNGVHRVLESFMSLSKHDQGKKMLDQEAYLRERIMKVTKQLEKVRNDNRGNEINELMYNCLCVQKSVEGLNLQDTVDLCLMTERTIDLVAKRIEFLQQSA